MLFKDYGEINSVNMLNFRADLSGKCFVEFVDADMASKAVAAVNGSVTHNDATFKVSLARASRHFGTQRLKKGQTGKNPVDRKCGLQH